ncbi:PREDICTED: putative sodium-dependent multivitamin transporter [Dinoponera quadriceps]|uniref:Sodium-dependent multivitamin transporter n=1 Tax=Dinoponera quadriceps TaxID=609295 RepID=A0A6P3X5V9_DINQU|nr:PREDICTED: putative sodium-dependent multivitamin transporter [Dinoponera quadriceps]
MIDRVRMSPVSCEFISSNNGHVHFEGESGLDAADVQRLIETPTVTETNALQWPDYLVISAVMSVSVFIGIYYRFSGGRQRTAAEYFSAENSMGILPLSIAMMASHISAITMLGISGESYIFGASIVILYVAGGLGIPLIVYCYLPVFFEMKVVSIYEYLEKRFGLYMRLLVSTANFTETLLLAGVMLYAPSIALEVTAGLSSTTSIAVIAVICTFYSTIGGIKAVLITDIFQGVLMVVAFGTLIGIAADNVDGGIAGIWQIGREGGRLDFTEWSFDPTVRYTWWNLLIGGMAIGLSFFAVNQVQVQRLMAVRDLKVAANALLLCGPFVILLGALTCFTGLSLYAVYVNCDPVASGKISSYDKILTYFTAERLSPGVIGLIVSGIFSASLSTVSAMMNSLAAVALEDYVKPLHRKLGIDFGDKKAIFTAKAFTFVNGVLCLLLALLLRTLGGLVVVALGIAGAIGGPILGIFTLGMFSETANETGTSIGMITALCICLWAVFGQPKPQPLMLPVSVEGCANSTIAQMRLNSTALPDKSSYFYLYRISHIWYNPIGLTITIIVGYIASIIIRLIRPENNIEYDPSLFVPFLAARIRRRRQDAEKTTGSQLFVLEPSHIR